MTARENFPVASALIRRDLRGSMLAFYAFARAADDIADAPGRPAPDKLADLERFAEGLHGDPAGAPQALALRARLAGRADRAALLAHGAVLLDAFRQDVRKRRYRDWEELAGYCRMSADPVGRFILDLHGEGPACAPPADALCTALQVLNHLQDMRGDYVSLGRVYLPQDWLREAGAVPSELEETRATPALRQVLLRGVVRCENLLREAADLPDLVRSRRLSGEVRTILALAWRLSGRLRRSDPLAARPHLSRTDFAAAAVAGFGQAVRPRRREQVAASRGPA